MKAAVLKQPQSAISSLYLGMQAATAAAIAGRQLAGSPCGRIDAEPLLHGCARIIAAAARAVVIQDSTGVCGSDGLVHVTLSANDATKLVTASPQLQQQLFSLLLCCIKLAAQHKPDNAHDKACGMLSTTLIAAAAAGIGYLLMSLPCPGLPAQPTGSSSNNSSDKAGRVARIQPWLLLVARSLNIMGVSASSLLTMQGPDQAKAPGAEQGSKRNVSRALAAGLVWQYMQQPSCEAINMLQCQQQLLAETEESVQSDVGEASPAGGMAATAADGHVLQQQDVLKNALVNALEKVQGLCRFTTNTNASITGSSSSSSDAEVLAQTELLLSQLGQQLQQAGAAVCAALPVPYCCNNPGCCSFRGESEQQLVSGKGCVCGGCQVARYCCTECQTAHWQQHKAVCKRLKKERLAGSSRSTAQLSSANC